MSLPLPSIEQLPLLAVLAGNDLFLGLVLLAVTATLIAFSVPGVIVPLSLSSGALLGGWEGAVVVTAGASLGSQAFFFAGRRWLGPGLRARHSERLARFERHLSRRAFVYLVGLRIAGVPHFLVTAAAALSQVRARTFALSTALGFAPAIALAATAGSAI